MGALSLAMAFNLVPLLAAARLVEVLGQRLVTALERLMGLLLSILAVEMLLQGVRAFAKTL